MIHGIVLAVCLLCVLGVILTFIRMSDAGGGHGR